MVTDSAWRGFGGVNCIVLLERPLDRRMRGADGLRRPPEKCRGLSCEIVDTCHLII